MIGVPSDCSGAFAGCEVRKALRTQRGRTADGFWLHLDLDVLSASALPAVDYADERGLSWEHLGELLGVALGSSQLIGARARPTPLPHSPGRADRSDSRVGSLCGRQQTLSSGSARRSRRMTPGLRL